MSGYDEDAFGSDALQYNVLKQRVDIEVDLARQSLKGSTELTIQPLVRNLKEVRLHFRQGKASGVQVNGLTTKWLQQEPYAKAHMPARSTVEQHGMLKSRIEDHLAPAPQPNLVILLPAKLKIQEIQLDAVTAMPTYASTPSLQKQESDAMAILETPTVSALQNSAQFAPIKIYIDFEVTEFRDGLHFVGCDDSDPRYSYVYSKAELAPGNTSCIFPCLDDMTTRCIWEIAITCPRTLGDAFRVAPAVPPAAPVGSRGAGTDIIMRDGDERDYVIPLEPADAALDLVIVSVGDMISDVVDSEDEGRHTATFSVAAAVTARHVGFAIGPFEHVDLAEFRTADEEERLGRSAIKIDAYCLPGHVEELRNTAFPISMMVDYFGVQFGSFPFSDYRMLFVDDLIFDTVPAAGLTFCSASLLFLDDILAPITVNTKKLIRTVADQWIGVNVIAKTTDDEWVVAGIAGFMTDMFIKKLFGVNEYKWHQKVMAEKIYELDVERPSLELLGRLLHYDPTIRDFVNMKSSMVLAILDRRLLKASNSTGVTRVINKIFLNAKTGTLNNGELTKDDFQRTAERLGHSKLEPFFRQWVQGAGCPIFDVKQRFNKKKLVVEMTITQRQTERLTKPAFQPSNFMREVKEDIGSVWAPEPQAVFTGPMTVRIHEADGTPYEHIIDIKEHVTKLDIPYNTKYKRLKRSRRQRERKQQKDNHENAGEGGEDALIYCLGDILETAEDVEEWKLKDWTPEDENLMGQESYEWIRMDTDFEWLGKIHLQMPMYMYVSQLQQDRDLVAQYESVNYIADCGAYQTSMSVMLRTLMDKRYFHGIRTLAAKAIAETGRDRLRDVGMFMLEKAFSSMFCFEGKTMTRPNDWSDRVNFILQCAIPQAMVKLRDDEGKVPMAVRRFFVDKLKFNDNSNNEYSDAHYIATLMRCLAQSLVISHRKKQPTYDFEFGDHDPVPIDEVDRDADFEQEAFAEIERYRRIDEWISSYQNIYSTTAIECLQMLTKAGIVKDKVKELLSYTRAENAENVRIAAFECLTEIGTTRKMTMMAYLLRSLEESHSPAFRARLLACFGVALGHIAIGDDDDETDGVNGAADGGLIVEQAMSSEARHLALTRKLSPDGALKALKLALQGELVFADALWSAATSDTLSVDEVAAVADIAALVFEPRTSLTLSLKLPRKYHATNLGGGKIKFVADGPYRISPVTPLLYEQWERMQQLGLKYTGRVGPDGRAVVKAEPTPPPAEDTAAILRRQIEDTNKRLQLSHARPSMAPPASPVVATPTGEKPKIKIGIKRTASVIEEAPKPAKRQQTPSSYVGSPMSARGSPAAVSKGRRSSTPGSVASVGRKAEKRRIVTLKFGKMAAARAAMILSSPPRGKSSAARRPSVEMQSQATPALVSSSVPAALAAPAWNPGGFRSFESTDSAPPPEMMFSPTDGTPDAMPGSIGGFRPLSADDTALLSPSEGAPVAVGSATGVGSNGNGGDTMPPPPKKKFTLKLGARKPSENPRSSIITTVTPAQMATQTWTTLNERPALQSNVGRRRAKAVPNDITFIDVSQAKPRSRRQMTPAEKLEYRQRRLLKPCAKCTKQKRRCRHDPTAVDVTAVERSSSSEEDLVRPDERPERTQATTRINLTIWDSRQPVESHVDHHASPEGQIPNPIKPRFASSERNTHAPAFRSHIPRNLQGATGCYAEVAPQILNSAAWSGVIHTWFQFAPQRLGHSHCFDLTFAALLTITNYQRGTNGMVLADCYRALQVALPAIRHATDSKEQRWDDLTLASIAAVYSCQPGKAEEKVISNPHLDGLMSMLTLRARHGPTTEFAILVCDFYMCDTYLVSCIRGIVSPLEEVEEEYCQPKHTVRVSTPSGDLRAQGNKLSIRLPRLLLLVRAATGSGAGSEAVAATLKSAESLVKDFEYTVRRSLYPNVGVIDLLQAKSPGSNWLTVVQPDLADLTARLHYWHTRIALLQMCLRLQRATPILYHQYKLPDTVTAQSELCRIYNDVLIAIYFARLPWCYLQRRVFLQALLMCWGALRSGDLGPSPIEHIKVEEIWLLARMHEILRPFVTLYLSAKDFDEAAVLFVGQRIAGKFKELFD
ncbi:Transcription initiation factor TFIID subunit 2 [Oleoguttula sp. CCFEE 5521]